MELRREFTHCQNLRAEPEINFVQANRGSACQRPTLF